jgi:hypothetical protein
VTAISRASAVRSAQTVRALGAALELEKPVEPTTLVASRRPTSPR